MQYVTIYNCYDPNEIPALEQLFEENKLDYRVVKGPRDDTVVNEGIKIQVMEAEKKRATQLLLEKGFLKKPPITQGGPSKSKFWIFLFLVVLIIIIIGVLVSKLA